MPPRLDFYYTNYTALGSRSLFIPNTHNVIIMVWLRIILHDAACMSGQNLNEKAVKVLHFACHSRKFCAPRDVRIARSSSKEVLLGSSVDVHVHVHVECVCTSRDS